MGVKNGLKDVGRVFGLDFATSNYISKTIDEINDKPGAGFKDFDAMESSENPADREAWKKFRDLEDEHRELFRLARAFEGTPRNTGVHASGILVTPGPISDYFPTHVVNDVAVTYFTGPQCESCSAIKLDILGLKNISIIRRTLYNISPDLTFNDLYDVVDINDPKIYEYISSKQTDAVFQLESDMMKGLIGDIKPTEFNDIIAVNSLGRPGPLSANMPQDYAAIKNGNKEISYPIKGCEDILDETYGVISYQEQLMQISKKVAGYDDMQADSICRKIVAKKKKSMFPLLIRTHIYGKINAEGPEGWENDDSAPWYDPEGKYGAEIKGAVANGYTPEEMHDYFNTIMGFADYCLTA